MGLSQYFAKWSLGLWSYSLMYPQQCQIQYITALLEKKKMAIYLKSMPWSLVLMPMPLSCSKTSTCNCISLHISAFRYKMLLVCIVWIVCYTSNCWTLLKHCHHFTLCFIKFIWTFESASIWTLCTIPGKTRDHLVMGSHQPWRQSGQGSKVVEPLPYLLIPPHIPPYFQRPCSDQTHFQTALILMSTTHL